MKQRKLKILLSSCILPLLSSVCWGGGRLKILPLQHVKYHTASGKDVCYPSGGTTAGNANWTCPKNTSIYCANYELRKNYIPYYYYYSGDKYGCSSKDSKYYWKGDHKHVSNHGKVLLSCLVSGTVIRFETVYKSGNGSRNWCLTSPEWRSMYCEGGQIWTRNGGPWYKCIDKGTN